MSDDPPTTDAPTSSEPPPGAPAIPDPPDLAPVPDDADDTRGTHLRAPARHPVTLIGGGVLAVVALASAPRRRASASARSRPARWSCSRPDRLADRQLARRGRLLQRLRRGPGPGPDRRALEPAADDAAAAQGRQPLRRAAVQRRPPRRHGRQPLPLHLRGDEPRLRRQPPDHLHPLHAGDDPAARHGAPTCRSCTASAGSASGSWTRPRTCSASASASSRSPRPSTRRYEIFIGEQRRHEQGPPGPLPHASSSGSTSTRPRRTRSSSAPDRWSATSRATRRPPPSSTRSARPRPRSPAGSRSRRRRADAARRAAAETRSSSGTRSRARARRCSSSTPGSATAACGSRSGRASRRVIAPCAATCAASAARRSRPSASRTPPTSSRCSTGSSSGPASLVGVSLGGPGRARGRGRAAGPRRAAGGLRARRCPATSGREAVREFGAAEDEALERGDLDAAVEANLRMWVDGPERLGADEVDPGAAGAGRRDAAACVRAPAPGRPRPPTRSRWWRTSASGSAEIAAPTLALVGVARRRRHARDRGTCSRIGFRDARSAVIDGTAHRAEPRAPRRVRPARARVPGRGLSQPIGTDRGAHAPTS